MALPADFSKIYGSAATGGLTPISGVNYAKGWEFVGSNPPTKNDFSYLQNLSDLKSQWLYSNKLQRTNPFGDIKSDGTVGQALSNLGLGEVAKLPSPSFITGPGYTLFKSPFMDGAVVRWFSTLSMSVTPPALTNNTTFSVTFPLTFSSDVMAVLSSDCGKFTNLAAQDLGARIDNISLTGLVISSRWDPRSLDSGDFKFIVTGVMNV